MRNCKTERPFFASSAEQKYAGGLFSEIGPRTYQTIVLLPSDVSQSSTMEWPASFTRSPELMTTTHWGLVLFKSNICSHEFWICWQFCYRFGSLRGQRTENYAEAARWLSFYLFQESTKIDIRHPSRRREDVCMSIAPSQIRTCYRRL